MISRFQCLILLVLINHAKGLELKVSDDVPYHPLGSNLTIYCTDESVTYIDWLRGSSGQSHLSACSLTRLCLPSGQKYTVDPKKRRFNINLYNLKYSDCETYWCKSSDNKESYKLDLIELINNLELHESYGKIYVTTGCVLPGFTVDIRWYYSYKDRTPRLYDTPATRVEDRGGCGGVCGDNIAVKVSSVLQFPTRLKYMIPVKVIAYVKQGREVRRLVSQKEYFIEGCPPSNSRNTVLTFLGITLLLSIIHMSIMVFRRIRDRTAFNEGQIYRLCIAGITFTFGLLQIILVIQEEQEHQDNCQDKSALMYLVAAVGYFSITLAGLLFEERWIYLPLVKDLGNSCIRHCRRRQNEDSNISGAEDADAHEQHETEELLPPEQTTTSNEVPTTRVQVKHGENTHLKIGGDTSRPCPVWVRRSPLNVELHGKLQAANVYWGTDKRSLIVRSCQQIDEGWYEAYVGGICIQRTHVEVTGKSVPDVHHEVTIGKAVGLMPPSTNETYPSWEYVDGGVYNVGGEEKFQSSAATSDLPSRWKWESDKRTLIIYDICMRDQGRYICRLSDGTIKHVNLIVKETKVSMEKPKEKPDK